jgi:hypothetical protein
MDNHKTMPRYTKVFANDVCEANSQLTLALARLYLQKAVMCPIYFYTKGGYARFLRL